MTPKITVLMAVYNSEKYLKQAMDSILAQSFSDFEFLIIDDCSTDSSLSIITSYGDPRIKVISNLENLGLTKSLNIGLKNAKGEYIARIDADDISLPNRLETQLDFLNNHPETILVGSWAECIDKDGNTLKTSRNPSDESILKFELIFDNLFIHSSIFFKKDTILHEGGYDESYRHSQDYELYSRLIQKYSITNIPKILIKLRLHSESVVAQESTQKIVYTNALTIIENNIKRYIEISREEFDILLYAMILKKPWRDGTFSKVRRAHKLLEKIYVSFLSKEHPSDTEKDKIHIRYKARRNMIYKHYFLNFYQTWLSTK